MSGGRTAILGLATAAPAQTRTQEEALAMSLQVSPARSEEERRQVEAIYRRSGIGSRGVAGSREPGAEGDADPFRLFRRATVDEPRGAGTAERMREYAARAAPLAERAAREALSDAGVQAEAVTHLVTATCTGFSSPGWDIGLVEQLGLPRSVLRTHVGFMGCHAAINALRVGAAFAGVDPRARVLVCCTEVCSIHFRYGARPDQTVANALFADGSAAAVVGASDRGVAYIGSSSSCVIPGSAAQMGWAVGDHGFEMNLGVDLPATIGKNAGRWLAEWLDGAGVGISGVRSWAVHPGGPKILGAVGEAAGLPGEAMRPSREVLAAHGNMSSPTVLFILEHMRRSAGGLSLPAVMVSFGPGVAAEGLLLV